MLYQPAHGRFTAPDAEQELARLAATVPATLVTLSTGGLVASILPMVFDAGSHVLRGHLARANPQWRDFSEKEVLLVFSGPHAYISPRWYEETERVPTWNYAAVHAYGVPRVIPSREEKLASQRRLVAAMDPQWLPKFDALPEKYVTMMLDGIVNFQVPVTRLETRWKLSQNRGRREMELIAEALEKSGDAAMAALTRKHYPK